MNSRYNFFWWVLILLAPFIVKAQQTPSASQNYIYTRTILKKGVKLATDLAGLPADSMRAEVRYFDGLGRPLQNVSVQASPDGMDLVTPIAYDGFGREDKTYLPYAAGGASGTYRPSALTEQSTFYAAPPTPSIPVISNPFSQTLFEASSLNRPLESAAPGSSWAVGNGHTIRTGYEINVADEVRLWNVTISGTTNTGASSPGYYEAGQLFKNITWDEHRNRVIEYKDKEGQVVCKKVQDGGDTLNAPTFMTTQYIYDDFNQLAYVIPPALENLTSFTETDANFLKYIYAYHYDGRRRQIERKIPGAGWEYTVYNKADRPVFSQDSMQRARGVWSFVKYDTLGRAVMTGETTNNSIRSALQTQTDGQARLNEVRDTTAIWGYTNAAIPKNNLKIFTINFFDDYSFLNSTVTPNPYPALFTQPAGTATETSHTHSLPTIIVTNVLDSASYLYAVSYYDEKGRVSKIVSQHLLNGADVVTNTYNFVGEITTSSRAHYTNGNTTTPALIISTTNQYDHAGRILRSIEKINTQPPDTISYTYNAIGQLETKKAGNQTTNYTYNARGWVKKQSAPLFSMELRYEDAATGNQQYNGNIGQQVWKSGNDTTTQRTYSYLYDRANRILSGISDEGYNENGITYDKMGNIKTLTRPKNNATAITYNYGSQGNQLQNTTGGYTRGYTYDGNGNVKTITGSDPLTISYNALNLPKQVTESAAVSYVYDAAGNKLKKVTTTETRWYIGGIEYMTNSTNTVPAIDLLHTQAGVARKSGTTYNYEYFLADHLGNTRVVHNGAGAVLQQTDYYPFGLPIERYTAVPNNYLYQGKELQRELTQFDFGARFYDPQIGRWHVVDPHASSYPSLSGYSAFANNPINVIDPDGRDVILLIWASHDGKIGHAGIAVSNYKEVSTRVKENGKWVTKKEMVADGTYTYRDLWPGGEGAGKSNFDKDLPGVYNKDVFTLDQLKNTDVTGSEGYAADGLIQLSTDYTMDEIVNMALDGHQKNNPSYNGLTNNCTDFVESGALYATDKKVDANENLTSKTSAATPNQLFKSASKSPNAKVIKDPGKKVDQGFIEAVSNGKEDKARKKID